MYINGDGSLINSTFISLKGSTSIRTLDELKELMDIMISYEKYEICSTIKFAIDNYDKEVQRIKESKISN